MSNSVELNKTNPINYNSIVFGGSGHLGHSICQTLKQHGSDVVTTYFNGKNKHNLEKLKDNDISCLLCDITNNNSVNDVIKQTKNKFPSINSMVYAIGSFNNLTKKTNDGEEFLSLSEVKEEYLDDVFAINTQGVITACQSTIELLKKSGGGNIVLLGTLNGTKMVPSAVHFAAAKAALLGITQSLAKELGKDNIRINLLVPGIVDGPNLKNIPEKDKKSFIKHSALRQFITVEQVANVVSWFALENTYVTGQTIIIDGGL